MVKGKLGSQTPHSLLDTMVFIYLPLSMEKIYKNWYSVKNRSAMRDICSTCILIAFGILQLLLQGERNIF